MKTRSDRFWAKVNKTETCWLWTATKTANGYGQFWFGDRLGLAHRWSFEQYAGPIPPGMDIDHICHVRACVNPYHLRIATRKQNSENLLGATRTSTSGFRGVIRHRPSGKWQARVYHEGRLIHCGYFVHIEDANAAAIAKRNELFTHNDKDRL